MADPCLHSDDIVTLKVKQAEIAGDVSYVKKRIDNGMSTSLKTIEDTVTRLAPIIEHHAGIVKRVEDFGWLISRWLSITFLTLIVGVIVWAIAKGFAPHI